MSSEEKQLTLNLKVWRQKDGKDKGQMVDYTLEGVSTDSSFLEMMDQLNEKLVVENQDRSRLFPVLAELTIVEFHFLCVFVLYPLLANGVHPQL